MVRCGRTLAGYDRLSPDDGRSSVKLLTRVMKKYEIGARLPVAPLYGAPVPPATLGSAGGSPGHPSGPHSSLIRSTLFPALLLAAPGALAQDATSSPPQPGPAQQAQAPADGRPVPSPRLPTVIFNFGSGYTFPADVKDTSARMTTTGATGRVTFPIRLSDRLLLSIPLDAGLRLYDFSGDPALFPEGGRPWDTVRFFSVAAQLRFRLDEHWVFLGGVNGASAGARGASFNKTLSAGGLLGFTYVFSPQLVLGLAVAGQSRPASGILVLPFPIIEWTLPFDAPHWRLVAGAVRVGPGDAGAALVYSPIRELSFSASLALAGLWRDFRLPDSGPHPNSVGRDTGFPLVLAAEWRPIRPLALGIYGGVAVFRTITLLDQDGNTLGEHDVAPAPIVGGTIVFGF